MLPNSSLAELFYGVLARTKRILNQVTFTEEVACFLLLSLLFHYFHTRTSSFSKVFSSV
jgi:hypothetical protein